MGNCSFKHEDGDIVNSASNIEAGNNYSLKL